MLPARTGGARTEDGFTLIELMMTVTIIALLVAMAVPTYIGLRERALNRAAQSDLRAVLVSEMAYWTDNGYFSPDQAALKDYEPTLTLVADHSVDHGVEATMSTDDGVVCLERTSNSGSVFGVWIGESTGTFYGSAAIGATCPTTPVGLDASYSQNGW